MSETDTESQLVLGLPENRDQWNNREWGIFTVRSLMYHVDIMAMEDVAELQGVLIRLEERARGEEPKQQEQQSPGEQLPGQMRWAGNKIPGRSAGSEGRNVKGSDATV